MRRGNTPRRFHRSASSRQRRRHGHGQGLAERRRPGWRRCGSGQNCEQGSGGRGGHAVLLHLVTYGAFRETHLTRKARTWRTKNVTSPARENRRQGKMQAKQTVARHDDVLFGGTLSAVYVAQHSTVVHRRHCSKTYITTTMGRKRRVFFRHLTRRGPKTCLLCLSVRAVRAVRAIIIIKESLARSSFTRSGVNCRQSPSIIHTEEHVGGTLSTIAATSTHL